jgi:hypothetical protein
VALDGLDDEGRDVARCERALERRQVVERNPPAAGQHRAEARWKMSSPFSDTAPMVSPWKACSQ